MILARPALVAPGAGQAADLLERTAIDHCVDALADGQAALVVLPTDRLLAAQMLGRRAAALDFPDFVLPAHRKILFRPVPARR